MLTLLALALPALTLAFASGCVEKGPGANSPPITTGPVEVSADRYELSSGEEISVQANSTIPGTRTLSVTLGMNEKGSAGCTGTGACSLRATFRPAAGAYSLSAEALDGKGQRLGISGMLEVRVLQGAKLCIDGTPFGKCAAAALMPKYCNAGILADDCARCGCPASYSCGKGGGCAKIPSPANAPQIDALKINFHYPQKIQAGRRFEVSVDFTPDDEVPAGSAYEAEFYLAGKKFASTFTSQGSPAGEMLAIRITGISIGLDALAAGEADMNFAIYALNAQRERGPATAGKARIVKELAALQRPQILSALAEGNDAVLSWLAADGAYEYRIYKSVDANPAFIQYALRQVVPAAETSVAVQALQGGTHFFVMTAADEFGNESAHSDVMQVNIG